MASASSPAPVSTRPITRPKYVSGLKSTTVTGPSATGAAGPSRAATAWTPLRPACAGDLWCIDAQKPHPRHHLLAEPDMDTHLDSVAIDNLHLMGASGPCQRAARPDTGMAGQACWQRRIRNDSGTSTRHTMVTVHQHMRRRQTKERTREQPLARHLCRRSVRRVGHRHRVCLAKRDRCDGSLMTWCDIFDDLPTCAR